ncbi:coenzyme PQQ precursor peptide PqqA [Bradyrhizobium lablabi]|jgi:coenzyme PQQ precursor peptide PqqA|uniref:Coenzyme PQQ synthesis protein A n=2 Tax=Bradyrhizobium TaxID=374 RepID=A0ABY0PYZ1_9BRAD|nr:coenzyme PQQ precursor peptide PqqA [Bradyrhizobium ottawaense]SEC83941.1 coenzyme PQQ precursor peptide PqqA [Bradyrhizobium lablabi]SHK93842.1 coenzyme PQQ precursor peptide PqqA [Bradyrhizobium lablabi]
MKARVSQAGPRLRNISAALVTFLLFGSALMTGKTPKIVEVQVGMEINMYVCAMRK